MTEMQIFSNPKFGEIRTLMIDGNMWFVGKDVAQALEYSNPQKAIRDHVDEQDKGVNEMVTPGGPQKLIIINESGLYGLIFGSKLDRAKEFTRWVTSEVLPSIRKTGSYSISNDLNNITVEVMQSPEFINTCLLALQARNEEIELKDAKIALQKQQICEMRPKVTYFDIVMRTKDELTITQIAKDYGMTGRDLNNLLHELHIQYKVGGQWVLYQEYANKGYTKTVIGYKNNSNGSWSHTYWTQKGRYFIYEMLKSQGILPLCERTEEIVG